MAIAKAQAEREAITAAAETQEHLREIIVPILAGPIGRTRGDRFGRRLEVVAPFMWRRLIGPIPCARGRSLMEPGCGDGIDLQGPQGHRTTHLMEVCREQGIEALPQSVIMQGGPLEPGREARQHPALPQACPDLVEGMMAVQNRQEQGLHPTSTGEQRPRVWRAARIDECSPVELAYHPQHQREVGHGTDLMNRDRHEAPPLQVVQEVLS